MVNIEVGVQTMTSYPDTLALAEWAESEGLAALAVADHYLTGTDTTYALDQIVVLGAVAARTERIQLSTLVSPITFRHPAVMLKSAVTLDEISGGRFTLGIGTGWMEEEHERFGFDLPPLDERFERLTEALEYIEAARDDDGQGFAGRHYRLASGPMPEPRGDGLRLVVGGSGPRRTPALAGRFADEYNAFPGPHPFGPRIEAARASAREAGRDADHLAISAAFPLVMGEDRAEAAARIEAVAARRGVDVDRVRTRYGEMGIPVGTVDEVLTAVEAMAADGVERVYFQVAFDPLEDIRHSIDLLRRHGLTASG